MVEIVEMDEVVPDARVTAVAKIVELTRQAITAADVLAAKATADLEEGRAAAPTGSARSGLPRTGQ